LLAQHVSGTIMPIIRSSRVLYGGCCLWYFVLWFPHIYNNLRKYTFTFRLISYTEIGLTPLQFIP